MDFVLHDFNGSDSYFAGAAASEWADIEAVLADLKPHFQPSDEARSDDLHPKTAASILRQAGLR